MNPRPYFHPASMMAAVLTLFLAAAMAPGHAHAAAAPAFEWAQALEGQGVSQVADIAMDPAGNIYMTGAFVGTVDFNPGQGVFTMTALGGSDIFVAKFNTRGGLVWAKAFFGNGTNEGLGIAVDSEGNVHTTGRFFGSADFDPNTTVFSLSAPGGQGIFTAKLDADGNFVWANAMADANSTEDTGYAIAVDGEGYVYSTGSFSGTTDFDTGSVGFPISAMGPSNIFVRKLAPDGSLVWAKALRGASSSRAHSIALDAGRNVLIAGRFQGTVDFDPGAVGFPITAAANDIAGESDAFVAKLTTDGDFVWAGAFGGAQADTEAHGIAVDRAGNSLVTGAFLGTTDFDPGPAQTTFTSGFLEDAFVAKLNAGGELEWAHAIGNPGEQRGNAVAVDGLGAAYVAGDFQGTVDFNPAAEEFTLTAANGGQSAFIWKLNAGGGFEWARATAGNGSSSGEAIATFPGRRVLAAGAFFDTVDFNPGIDPFPLSSVAGSLSGFLWSHGQGDAVSTGLSGRVRHGETDLPLPCAVVELTAPDGARHAAASGLDGEYFFKPLPPGDYSVRVLAPGFDTRLPGLLSLPFAQPEPADFRLDPADAAPVVTGRLIDADSGHALAGAAVELRIGGEAPVDTRTCGAGRYEFPLPGTPADPPVTAELSFTHPNFEPEVLTVELDFQTGGEWDAELQRVAAGTAAITGQVLGEDLGIPVPRPNARVELHGPVRVAASVSEDGSFAFTGLPDGPYTVTASAPAFQAQSVWRQVQGEEAAEVSFTLEPSDTPPPIVPGDINGDGVVNATDVQLVINAALGIDLEPGLDADINGDGVVNAVDVQLVINAALGIPI